MENKVEKINYIKDILDCKLPLLEIMDVLDNMQHCKLYDYEYYPIKNTLIIGWLYNNDLIITDFLELHEPTEKFDEIYLIIKKQLEEYDECVA